MIDYSLSAVQKAIAFGDYYKIGGYTRGSLLQITPRSYEEHLQYSNYWMPMGDKPCPDCKALKMYEVHDYRRHLDLDGEEEWYRDNGVLQLTCGGCERLWTLGILTFGAENRIGYENS